MNAPDPRAAAHEEIGIELKRVVLRWQELPLDHALSAVPQVQALVQSVADSVCEAAGLAISPVPDLGPAVLMDQLRVMVHDHAAADLDPIPLAAELTALRRSL